MSARLTRRQLALLRATQAYLQLNSDADATLEDAIEHSMGECGRLADGSCLKAGSEACDFECPWVDGEA